MADQLTSEGLERFGAVARSHVGATLVPGLVAVVARGDQVHVETLGSLTIGGPPVRRDSLFRIASTSKPVAAAAAMALVQEGLFAVDESVDRLLPELAGRRVLNRMDGPLEETVEAHRSITVRDLLTFTCGFGMLMEMFTSSEPWPVVAEASRLHLATLGPPDPAEQPDPDTWIEALGSLPLLAQPGERWLYNTGASVLGVLMARAAAAPLADVLSTRLFDPLGMSDTAFWAADTTRFATCYQATSDGLQVWDPPDGKWSRRPAFGDAAAGLVSTADDMLAFARMLLEGGGHVLSGAAVAEMTRDQLTTEQKTRDGKGILEGRSWAYCQAVAIDGPNAGSYGWDGGLGTSWLVDPAQELIVIVLTQRMFDSPHAPPVHRELQAAAYSAVA